MRTVRLCEICSSPIPYHDQGPKRYATRRYCSRACSLERWYRASADEFWSKVEKTDGCWLWRGTISTFGYGVTGWRGERWSAHRLAWTLTNGPIPDGKHVCHHCDNPPCARPDHLFLGEAVDNMRDMWAKGRGKGGFVKGEQVGTAKLTDDKVREIRARWDAGEAIRAIARDTGMSRRMIGFVVHREFWRHVA